MLPMRGKPVGLGPTESGRDAKFAANSYSWTEKDRGLGLEVKR